MAAHPAVLFGRTCADAAHSTEASTAIRIQGIIMSFVGLVIIL